MPSPTLVNLSSLIDDAKCVELVRQHRWPEGIRCPHCGEARVARDGRDVAELVAALTPARAKAIGEAALARILREHTYHRRGAQVDAILREEGALKHERSVA